MLGVNNYYANILAKWWSIKKMHDFIIIVDR